MSSKIQTCTIFYASLHLLHIIGVYFFSSPSMHGFFFCCCCFVSPFHPASSCLLFVSGVVGFMHSVCEFHGPFQCDVMFVAIEWKIYEIIGWICVQFFFFASLHCNFMSSLSHSLLGSCRCVSLNSRSTLYLCDSCSISRRTRFKECPRKYVWIKCMSSLRKETEREGQRASERKE